MSAGEECDAVVRWNILFLHFFSPFPNICSFFFLSFSFYHYYYYSHIYSIPLYLYLRVSRDVVLSLFAGRGERSFGRSNKKKKKIHPFEPYGKEIRKRKRDGVSVGTSSSRLRVLSGHGNGCQLFFSFPPLRASSNFLLPFSLTLSPSFSRPSAWIPFDREEGSYISSPL